MPDNYFPPIKHRDRPDEQWAKDLVQRQTISFQKIITGTLQAGNTLESSNFVSGTSGWQIDGDGNAEFNDVTVRGDIESNNWDGSSPADLSSVDSGATAGFYLDSSAGAAQFEGDIFLGGDLRLAGGTIATDVFGNDRVLLDDQGLKFFDGSTQVGILWGGAALTGFFKVEAQSAPLQLSTAGTHDIVFKTNSVSEQARFLDGGSGSVLSLRDGLTDVGNHETLRLDRGTGTTLKEVGYFSSWAEGKEDIISLTDSPRFPGLSIIDSIRAVDFERKSTKMREWGFLLDEFKELDDNLRYLTTKGDQWGYSPDENAIAALLLEGVKDLRATVKRQAKQIAELSGQAPA